MVVRVWVGPDMVTVAPGRVSVAPGRVIVSPGRVTVSPGRVTVSPGAVIVIVLAASASPEAVIVTTRRQTMRVYASISYNEGESEDLVLTRERRRLDRLYNTAR